MHKEKQIKVLMINTVPMEKNGISNVICNLIANTKDEVIYDCVTINKPDQYYYELLENKGCKIYVLSSRDSFPLKYIISLARLVKKGGYDCVHVHGNSHILAIDLFAAWLGGCKCRIAHSHNTTCRYLRLNKILNLPFNMLCTNNLACGSDAGRWLFGNRKFEIVRNGINTKRFIFDGNNRKKIRESLNIKDDEIVIGHVGEFNDAKNQIFILEILKKCNEKVKAILIGSGNNLASIKKKSMEVGLENRIYFPGAVFNVHEYLSAFDVVVMPSIYEGLPLTLVEEQANGLDCIVSDNITKEVNLTNNVSFLSLRDDVNAWRQEIISNKMQSDRTSKSIQAISTICANGYDIELEASKLVDYYKMVVKR